MVIEIISPKEIKTHYDLKNVLGKKVIADNGEIVGKVKDIAFDLNKIVGLYVKIKGKKVLINKGYIQHFHANSVILKIDPIITMVGKIVYDDGGEKIGKVVEINQTSTLNDFKSVIVKKNIFSKRIEILKRDMKIIGKNIILGITIENE